MKSKEIQKEKVFEPYLEFYWKFIAVCAVILLVVSILSGTIEEGTFTLKLNDPIVILLFGIISFSGLSFLFAIFKGRTITVGTDYLTLKSRFGKKEIAIEDIDSIRLGRERLFQFKAKMRVLKIKLKNKRRLIRIRPSTYVEDKELSDSILLLKKKLK